MKLVFTENGTDRAGEIDDWMALLQEQPEAKKLRREAPPQKELEQAEEEREEEPAEEHPARPGKTPVRHEELHPTRKPLKELERQPPVKRLIALTREPEPEPEAEPGTPPQRRVQIRTTEEPQKPRIQLTHAIPAPARSDSQVVRRPEVHAAMRTAMNNPVQPVRQPASTR